MRRPAVNVGPNPYNNYYDDMRPYHREWELDKQDRDRAKKYCPFDNILLVYNSKDEHWLCPKCGWSPESVAEVDKIEQADKSLIETSTHYRTNPKGKHSEIPVHASDDYSDSIMKVQSITGNRYAKTTVLSYEERRFIRGIDQSKTSDSDLSRLKAKGYTLINEYEQSDSNGTLSSEDLRKEKERRIRSRR